MAPKAGRTLLRQSFNEKSMRKTNLPHPPKDCAPKRRDAAEPWTRRVAEGLSQGGYWGPEKVLPGNTPTANAKPPIRPWDPGSCIKRTTYIWIPSCTISPRGRGEKRVTRYKDDVCEGILTENTLGRSPTPARYEREEALHVKGPETTVGQKCPRVGQKSRQKQKGKESHPDIRTSSRGV